MGRAWFVGVVALLAVALGAVTSAHEIPRSVTVNLFVKPEGDRLHVLVRVPLVAMRDIEFPQRDGFLDVTQSEPSLIDAVARWIVPELQLFEDGRAVASPVLANVRLSLPSDRSFASFDAARAHLTAPALDPAMRLSVDQALLDAWLEYRVASDRAAFSMRPAFQRLGVEVVTAVRFVSGRTTRAFEFSGDPGVVTLDPRWHQAAAHFVRLGFLHILDGADHLLFLVCLVVPVRRLRPLVLVVTAFTLAHSATLVASAMGLAPDGLWFPPLVEVLIAGSIVYMAIENVVAAPSIRRRCAMAFGFGLVHGFGFSFALQETLQFAGDHLLASLVSFNLGVELGQLLVIAALVPAAQVLFRRVVAERLGTIILSVMIGHTAWHWMTDRWTTLREFSGPTLDVPTLITLTRLAIVLVIGAGLIWIRRRVRGAERVRGDGLNDSLPNP